MTFIAGPVATADADACGESSDDPARVTYAGLTAARGPVEMVAVALLRPADTPLLGGEDAEHVRALAETDAVLLPILVHRQTMRVIDGMFRLRAAELRGCDTVEVQFFDGGEDMAFVLAVEATIAHGLPLSFSDREAAARRIIVSHAHWSDRAIASATGLAAKTVGAIRARETGGSAQPHARVGRDGRLRPLSTAEGRRRASQMISDNPAASLREIARVAGISPTTARDVRERMRRGDDPIPAKQRPDGAGFEPPRSRVITRNTRSLPRIPLHDRTSMLQNLRRDPSLRFTESGRALLLWLDARVTGTDGGEEFIATIPAHCAYVVAEIARGCADEWLAFAEQMKERTAQTVHPPRT